MDELKIYTHYETVFASLSFEVSLLLFLKWHKHLAHKQALIKSLFFVSGG